MTESYVRVPVNSITYCLHPISLYLTLVFWCSMKFLCELSDLPDLFIAMVPAALGHRFQEKHLFDNTCTSSSA